MRADSLEELEAFLRGFSSWGDPDVFDFGASVHLFAACVDCLRAKGLDAELEEVGEYLTEQQSEFLFRLVNLMRDYDKRQKSG